MKWSPSNFTRRFFLFALGLSLAGSVWFIGRARAEYSEAPGDINSATREASAKLNDALTEFHSMAAAIDRRKTDDAESHRSRVTVFLEQAANAYEATRADQHTLQPRPRTDDERQFVDYFKAHAAEYHIASPLTQSSLILDTSRLIRNMAHLVADKKVVQLQQNTIQLQQLSNSFADLQKFLISATTILMIG